MGSDSCAQGAYKSQGVERDIRGNITDDVYAGHDSYQNGVIPNQSDSQIYCTAWYDGQPGSGYFTDQSTVDSCIHGGQLNSNELGNALQTAPSNFSTGGGDYQQKPICTAYDIDWNKLDEIKNDNPDLYGRLTNPDGLSPDNDGIKCAYGTVEANYQYKEGGGNQYYIDRNTFNDAVDAGVFKENQNKSFSEDKGNLTRTDIPNTPQYDKELSDNKKEIIRNEDAKGRSTPEQINGYQAAEDPSKPYIAQPDEAYGYSQSQNTENTVTDKISNNNNNNNDDSSNNNMNAPPAAAAGSQSGKTDSSGGMSNTAAGSQSGKTDSSGGMSGTAAGQSSGPAPSSGSQSNHSGMSM